MEKSNRISRRDFLKLAGVGTAWFSLSPVMRAVAQAPVFPDGPSLGRVCVGKVDLRARPSVDSPSVGVLYQDGVVSWLREVVGPAPMGRVNRRWVETPEGYIYAPSVQPVRNMPNQPVTQLPESSGGAGMWAEVTVPYVDVVLANPPARSPSIKDNPTPRLYYSQLMWIDGIRTGSQGNILYRVNEKYGTLGDIFWADARAFRPITAEEITPIHPGVENKRIEVNVDYQTLSCYEGETEVYYCLISSGGKWDAEGNVVDKWSTPVGPHPIWRKLVSIHMLGGTTGAGYDLPGIAWTSLFSGEGVAIHSTFWHNDYGVPRSHGCVNARPEDAKWIFRWTLPVVAYDPGDMTVQMPGGTIVKVVES
ncbi:MAG: L,D-transpeptidase family protein [Chloroflexi bacterium]|nr:L,D-transpeptidase family protein [Chloroflexota bacterium]